MRILVTGITGFVGKHLIQDLAKTKYKVRCLVRYTSNVDFLKKYKVELFYGDITDKASVRKALEGVDEVIHLAAVTSIDNWDINYQNNYIATKILCEECKKLKIKRLIALSSVATLLDQLTNYGKTKLMADEAILKSKVPYVIIRPPMVYGKGDHGLSKMLKIVKKIPVIPMIGSGKALMQPVYVKDLTWLIMEVLKNKKIADKIYNAAGPRSFTWNEYVDMCMERLKVKRLKVPFPIFLAKIIAYSLTPLWKNNPLKPHIVVSITQGKEMDISEAQIELNYRPREFREIIKKYEL